LPFSIKGHFSKIVCMHKLHYPRPIGNMLKEPLSEKLFFVLRGLIPRRKTFKLSEYLLEFVPEFKIVLGYETGAHMGSIQEKKPEAKNLVLLYL
jgi:hypothetical protein